MKTQKIKTFLIFSIILYSAGIAKASPVPDDSPVMKSNGAFNVSATGGATYSYLIAAPPGTGGIRPNVSVVYNSQTGNGIVGWGCSLNGLSSITRGMKTVCHDGAAKGIAHTTDDAYYLDGIRLILVSGTAGYPGALYSPENSPATKVSFRGTLTDSWIEVKLPDGQILYYGNTEDSRQTYTNSSGYIRTNAWYINKVEDVNGNYMTYRYLSDNGMAYPQEIMYGKNKNKDTGTYSYIKFAYEQREDKQEVYIEDCKVMVSQRLKYIESGTGGKLYRRYELGYTTGDKSGQIFSRLHSVTEQNAEGYKRNPVVLDWNFLPAFSQKSVTPSINLKKSYTENYGSYSYKTEIDNEMFMSCDMTGNGLDDIVELATCMTTETYPGGSSGSFNTPLYVYKAHMNNGTPEYSLFKTYNLGFSGNILGIDCNKLGSYQLDFDCDGLADVCVPENVEISGHSGKYIRFALVRGKEVSSGSDIYKNFYHELKGNNKNPHFATADIDGNGRTDIIVFERSAYNGKYVCEILGHKNEDDLYRYEFSAILPAEPENIYTGDFDNNGMPDIIVFYKGGYKIYFNNGGRLEGGSIFSESSVRLGNTIGYVARMFQGDFNGDGLADFLMNDKNNRNWYFALGCGNGTFDKVLACSSDLYKHDEYDDDKMQCIVMDFDNDGKTDVVMTNYIESSKQTRTHWMRSTGAALTVVKQAYSASKDDALSARFTTGNFTGNGQTELLNYGYDCYNGNGGKAEPQIHIYYNENYAPNSGKVVALTDETGHKIDIAYSSLAEEGVYSRGQGSEYPIMDYTVPLHVVKNFKTDNGAAGSTDVSYRYKGLKLHAEGRGLLGMSSVTATDNITGNIVETGTECRDEVCFAPSKTYVKKTMGSFIETTRTTNTYNKNSNKTFALQKTVSETVDPEIFYATSTKVYDPNTGALLSEKEEGDYYGNCHEITYSDFTDIAGRHMPQTLTYIDSHIDDDPIERQTRIKYNERGLKISECVNSGLSLPVTNEYSYDVFGNIISSSTSGYGIDKVLKKNEFDASGRFVTKKYTAPASVATAYTYDTWGNVITESDITDTANTLVTTYAYDTWGNAMSVISPTGVKAEITRGWNSDPSKRYYILRHADGEPWVKTWYDSMGREVLKESVGLKDVDIKTETEYDKYGQAAKVISQNGDITVTKTNQYDRYGRIINETSSNAGTVTYAYSGRHITVDDNGREYVKEYGDWGYTRSIMESLGDVYYTYNSFFKPVEVDVLSGNSVVRMEYDDVGNRTVLDDPDAGCTTYTHDALGRVRTQTDARGQKASFTFDSFGHQTRVDNGNSTFAEYTYGSTGNSAQRLIKEQSGNMYATYSYDGYGRMLSKTRHIDGEDLNYSYTYNSLGQVTRMGYPGGVTVDYEYDSYGNNTSISVGGKTVWNVESSTGKSLSVRLGDNILEETKSDDSGRTVSRILKKRTDNSYYNIYAATFSYDKSTGNLKSKNTDNCMKVAHNRYDDLVADTAILIEPLYPYILPYGSVEVENNKRINLDALNVFEGISEAYSYDDYDRLTEVKRKNNVFQTVEYDDNGNILSKTKVGTYSYDHDKVHALTDIDATDSGYSPGSQDVSYNFFGKAETVSGQNGDEYRELSVTYGPDMERWKSVMNIDGEESRTVVYSDDYESVCEKGMTRQFYYIGGNVIYVRQTGKEDMVCYAFTDNQGSILCLVDDSGSKVFEASYDAWGNQNVISNKIGFIRGYTGHEMLPEFGLINMNGRIYDPVISRFLSPDNYVQMPENSQSFNRYTYCLNNPLKYTDPSGDLFGFSLVMSIFDTFTNILTHGFAFNNYSYRKTVNAWKIDMGMFKGDFGQILNKWTWSLPVSLVGNTIAHGLNAIGKVHGVTNMNGMLALSGVTGKGEKAFTLGHYSMGPDGYVADWRDHLFVHEYGHYIQTQQMGLFYFPVVAIPSLISASHLFSKDTHRYRWYEVDASRQGAEYFDKRYGSGAEGYTEGNENYFDIKAFHKGGETFYINPRTGKSFQKEHLISGARHSVWDYLLPIIFI